jgi:type I restriction enzyme S subunit
MSQALYDLPEGWAWKRLEEVCEYITDGAHASPASQEEGLPYVTVKDIASDGSIDVVGCKKISQINFDLLAKANCSPRAGAVLLSKDGTVGKVALVDESYERFVVLSSLAIIHPNSSFLTSNFLKYYLLSPALQEEAIGKKSGAAIKRIVLKTIKAFEIPLPPLAEQTRIVEKLEAVLSRIDTAIDELQQSLALVDAMFKSGLDGVFAGLALLYNVTALSQVVKINSGIALPSIFKESHASGAIPFYKVAQMNNHTEIMTGSEILFSGEVSKTHKVTVFPKGSVLIPKRGGAILTNKKRILVEDASYDSNIMGLKANNQLISDEYLFAFMQSIDLSDFVDASTIPQINNKHVDQMMIPVPSLSEQEKAVKHINELTNYTTQLKTELTAQIGMFNQLKASVLDGAFRGEV